MKVAMYCRLGNKPKPKPYWQDFRREEICKTIDTDIILYLSTSNYLDDNNNLLLLKKKRIEDFCNENKFVITEQYMDIGIKSLGNTEPAFKKLLKKLKDGRRNILIVNDIRDIRCRCVLKCYIRKVF